MTIRRNSKAQIDHRRARVATEYLRGREQREIAADLGVSQSTVCLDLKFIRNRWRESCVRNFDEIKGRELERIDTLEREYWAAWDASKDDREITSTEKTSAAGDEPRLKAAVRKESREGNAAFLAGVQWCVERRCKLLGLDPPGRTTPTTPDGAGPYRGAPRFDLAVLTDEQLDALEGIRATLERGNRAGTLPALRDPGGPPTLPDPQRDR